MTVITYILQPEVNVVSLYIAINGKTEKLDTPLGATERKLVVAGAAGGNVKV